MGDYKLWTIENLGKMILIASFEQFLDEGN